jgi:NAD(P)-dependent dehydrogenase (short-subunit alcohol dehydrogenase family)
MKIDLSDQVALVTGSARRVGKAIALELAKAGTHIMVHYHNSDKDTVRDTLHEIKSHGVDAFAVQADIATADGIATIFQKLSADFGRLNILVNSASLFNQNELMDVSLEDWQQSLNVNLTAPFLCTQAAVPLMRQNDTPGGAIINICDRGSMVPWPNFFDHGISKAGLWMLTKTSAVSLGKENIRVNGVLPGPVLIPPGMPEERWAEIGKSSPLKRTGQAEDVARAVVYLAAEDYITGTIIEVNGGEHLCGW